MSGEPQLCELTFIYDRAMWKVNARGQWFVLGTDYFHYAAPTGAWLHVDSRKVPQKLMACAARLKWG